MSYFTYEDSKRKRARIGTEKRLFNLIIVAVAQNEEEHMRIKKFIIVTTCTM